MHTDELIIDSFAGGGGASLGIHLASGRSPDVAINHDGEAIAMHAANHPETRHFTEDVWSLTPDEVTGNHRVALWWFSPDCRHFSRAKGATPVKKEIRSLAWVVCRCAAIKEKKKRPRVIILENVREFEEWGPLVPRWECRGCGWRGTEGQTVVARRRQRCPQCESVKVRETFERVPDPSRKGLTFKRFVGRLKGLGYAVEWRTLNAADFGAPTHRRRLFLIARRDGEPIAWPEATHGDPKKIDAADDKTPLFSGFDERPPLKPWRTAAECIDWSIPCPSIFERKKPLADATMKRIAMGIKRYVIDAAKPFIVSTAHTGTTGRGRYEDSLDDLLKTVTQSNDKAIITPYVVPVTHHGERRAIGPKEPLKTVTGAHRGEFAVVAPVIASLAHGGGGTFGDGRERSVESPLGTVHAGGGNYALASAFLAKHFGGFYEQTGAPLTGPFHTITASDHHAICAANLVHMNHGEKQWNGLDTSNNHAALVYSFLVKYFGTAIGQAVDDPLGTVTGKDRFGLVMVHIDGEPYVIVDIGMRMLTPRELARAQGFPDDYILTGTKTSQVHKIGNSVSPPVARAIVEANFVGCWCDERSIG